MPSLGLLLEQPIFESYNNRISSINERLEPSHPDYRPVIDFDLYRDIIEEFKESYIFHRMRTIEDRNAVYVDQSQVSESPYPTQTVSMDGSDRSIAMLVMTYCILTTRVQSLRQP